MKTRSPILLMTVVMVCSGWLAVSEGNVRPSGDPLTVQKLRCEYLVDPLGIDVAQPRLSWTLESKQRGQV